MNKKEILHFKKILIETKKVREELKKRDKMGKLPPRWFMKELMDESKMID